ncbi:MAG: hypothetical protein K0T99_02170 [Alphaproteobacteria bacterium]|nr:hypothetical protein [Alphaproteobacteria bacterium]
MPKPKQRQASGQYQLPKRFLQNILRMLRDGIPLETIKEMTESTLLDVQGETDDPIARKLMERIVSAVIKVIRKLSQNLEDVDTDDLQELINEECLKAALECIDSQGDLSVPLPQPPEQPEEQAAAAEAAGESIMLSRDEIRRREKERKDKVKEMQVDQDECGRMLLKILEIQRLNQILYGDREDIYGVSMVMNGYAAEMHGYAAEDIYQIFTATNGVTEEGVEVPEATMAGNGVTEEGVEVPAATMAGSGVDPDNHLLMQDLPEGSIETSYL